MTPRQILVVGWLVVVLYAYPGYMSYDSVLQLLQARAGEYGGGHPPAMGLIWGGVDNLVAGPFGMLVIQVTCFLVGAYLVLRRCMSARTAAIAASLIAWFPPISAVLAVIWKDSQMAAFLMLGTALLLSPRRSVRLGGLGVLFLASAMRFNALVMTLPLVVLLFEWEPGKRWWQRYGIALGAWLAISLGANSVNKLLESDELESHLWHDSLALLDITGTLRYAPDMTDDQVRMALAGTPLAATGQFQRIAREPQRSDDLPELKVYSFGGGEYVPGLWLSTFHLFRLPPSTPAERDAITKAWRTIVLGNTGSYLTYRWHATRERLQLGTDELPSATYVWFADVIDIETSMQRVQHMSTPSKLQAKLQRGMLALGRSSLFRPWIYLALSLVLLAFAWRDRVIFALALSGIANETALFVLAPTIDYRYSVWLVITTLVVATMLVGARAQMRSKQPPPA